MPYPQLSRISKFALHASGLLKGAPGEPNLRTQVVLAEVPEPTLSDAARVHVMRVGTIGLAAVGAIASWGLFSLSAPILMGGTLLAVACALVNLGVMEQGGSLDRACQVALSLLFAQIVLATALTGGFDEPMVFGSRRFRSRQPCLLAGARALCGQASSL